MISVVVVIGSLLAVVLGHAMEAQTQVRLSADQAALSAEQTTHREDVLALAQLETPSRIAAEAQSQLHMVTPSQVVQVPSVSLTTPLPTPKVAPAPSGTTTAPTAPTATTVASTARVTAPGASGTTTTGVTAATGSSDPTHATTGAGQAASVPGQ